MGVFKIGKTFYVDFYYNGRRVRRAVGSKKDAENALTAVKADILRGEYRFKRERRIKFEDFAKEYLKHAEVNKKSWKSDKNSLNNLIPYFKGMILSKITPRHVEEYKAKRVSQVRPASVNRELACLKYMYSLAIKWKLADENPVKEVKLFQERKIEMHIMKSDEISRLLNYARGHLNAVVIIALNTGMRKGEILRLRWNDIDFFRHDIFIKETKSGRSRKVPMNHLVRKTLMDISRDSEYIFHNPRNKAGHIKEVKTAFKNACRKSNLEDLRFHDLRHTAASKMVEAGVDIVTVAEILGHSDIKMTMRYVHPTPENKSKAVNVLAVVCGERDQETEKICSEEELEIGSSDYISSN
jgi:integrase